MSARKEIGKIKSISFGYGGYQGAMLGFHFELGGESWGVSDFQGMWTTSSEGAKWTERDRTMKFGESVRFVWELMEKAKKKDFLDLQDVPVEITFDDNNRMTSWRILTEVI